MGTDSLLQRNKELSVLNAIAEGLNRSVDLREALQTTLRLVAELLDLRSGWVWLLDEETGEEILAAAQNLPPILLKQPRRMTGNCYCLRTFRSGDLHGAANVNVVECSRLEDAVEGTEGLQYHASIPIYAGDKRLGMLNLATDNWRELDADELQLLYTIGYQVGIAVERARLHERTALFATAEERNRLARELHDSLAQSLTAVTLQLEAADAVVTKSPEKAQPKIEEALRLAREALIETRRVVHDLRAGALQGKSLPQALRELGATYARTYGFQVAVTSSGPAGRLTPHLEAGLFRIAQEAITNAARHAAAANVRVRLVIGPEKVVLSVKDDGRGFDPDRCPEPEDREGFGLKGMIERARLLGGALRIESAPGVGTRIEAVVPLGGLPWPT